MNINMTHQKNQFNYLLLKMIVMLFHLRLFPQKWCLFKFLFELSSSWLLRLLSPCCSQNNWKDLMYFYSNLPPFWLIVRLLSSYSTTDTSSCTWVACYILGVFSLCLSIVPIRPIRKKELADASCIHLAHSFTMFVTKMKAQLMAWHWNGCVGGDFFWWYYKWQFTDTMAAVVC